MSLSGVAKLDEVRVGALVVVGLPDLSLAGCRVGARLRPAQAGAQLQRSVVVLDGTRPCFKSELSSDGHVVVTNHTGDGGDILFSTISVNAQLSPTHANQLADALATTLARSHTRTCVLPLAQRTRGGGDGEWRVHVHARGEESPWGVHQDAVSAAHKLAPTTRINDTLGSALVHMLAFSPCAHVCVVMTNGFKALGKPNDGSAEVVEVLGKAVQSLVVGVEWGEGQEAGAAPLELVGAAEDSGSSFYA